MHQEETMARDAPSHWVKLIDEESGLYNRLYLIHFLGEAFARARRYGTPLSCILFEARWWRGLEEIRGAGEVPPAAIRRLGRGLLLGGREGDILGRWSNEEFLLVAPNTSLEGAGVFQQKALRQLVSARFEEAAGLVLALRAGAAGLPEDEAGLRYPEDLPLLARERLLAAGR